MDPILALTAEFGVGHEARRNVECVKEPRVFAVHASEVIFQFEFLERNLAHGFKPVPLWIGNDVLFSV